MKRKRNSITILRRNKPAKVAVNIKVDEDWISFAVHNDDLFMTSYCGYWMRGMEYDKRLGWLCFEHGGEKNPPAETPARVMAAWRDGSNLPKRWHRLDRDNALISFAEGVRLYGEDWYGGEGADAHRYDEVVQLALLGKLVYG